MGGMNVWLVIVASLAIVCMNVKSYDDVESVLELVPKNERKSFLKHHILLGYELSNANVEKNEILRFSVELYEKYRKDHMMKGGRLVVPDGTVICFPNGECIDIDDPGVHPLI